MAELHNLAVHSAVTTSSGSNTQLAVAYTTRLGQSTGRGSQGSKTVCFPASALPPNASEQPIAALTECQSVFEVVDVMVGMYRERLIFPHFDGWICSVKAGAIGRALEPGAGKVEGLVHHFAPPLGWLRTSRELFVRVSRLGDVLFVVKGEVEIVKRGLDRAADVTGKYLGRIFRFLRVIECAIQLREERRVESAHWNQACQSTGQVTRTFQSKDVRVKILSYPIQGLYM